MMLITVVNDFFPDFFSFFVKGADVEARDYSGRKPKHYIKESMSLWLQSKFMD